MVLGCCIFGLAVGCIIRCLNSGSSSQSNGRRPPSRPHQQNQGGGGRGNAYRNP